MTDHQHPARRDDVLGTVPRPLPRPEEVPPDVAAVLAGLEQHPALAARTVGLTAATAAELARLARSTAEEEASWRDLVRFEADHRCATRIAATKRYESWVLTWLPGQRSSLHRHGGACGAFAVARGSVEERTLRDTAEPGAHPGVRETVRRLTAGQVRVFGPDHLHEVSNPGPEPAVCVYVYTPARPDMEVYEVIGDILLPTGQERGRP